MKRYAWFALCGGLMGIALVVAGITRPEVVSGWLDFTGEWDPTLFVFFAPAVAVFHGMLRWARARERRSLGPALCLPAARGVDSRLVLGAAVFGTGWSLASTCPAPAIASLGAGAPWAFVFVAAMMIGFVAGDRAGRPSSARDPHAVEAVRNAAR